MTAARLLLSVAMLAMYATPLAAEPLSGGRLGGLLSGLRRPSATDRSVADLPPPPALTSSSQALIWAPLPRLRPSVVPSEAYGPGIDAIVTASVPPAPAAIAPTSGEPTAPVATATPAPAPPPPVSAPPAAISDGLLGDPSVGYTPPPSDTEPRLPGTQTIAAPRPEGGVAVAAEPRPPAAEGEPYQLMRSLQLLQDRTAQGSAEALVAQRVLIRSIDEAFVIAPLDVWTQPRNALAAVAFVLSGGPPNVLRKLAALDPRPPIDPRLIDGVLAYAEGREAEATTLLSKIDALDMAPSAGAQLAIAQSALAVKTNPEEALRLLGTARLLAPGTLVEEAAIRRAIFVADQLRDEAAVQSLARQYLDRFRHSVYAGNFRTRFAAAVSHMDFVDDPAQFGRLDDMLAAVEPAARAELFLTVALSAVVKARTNAARLAAQRVMALTAPNSLENERARLYHAAALVASAADLELAEANYESINRNRLSASDQALYDTVGMTLASVRSATDLKALSDLPPPPDAGQPTALMARAATLMKGVDALLEPTAK